MTARQSTVSLPELPGSQQYLPMPFAEELEVLDDANPVCATRPLGKSGAGGSEPSPAMAEQALAWARSKLRSAANGNHLELEAHGKVKKRKLSGDASAQAGGMFMSLLPNGMPNDVPDAHAAPFTAAAVDWAAVASTLSDRAALLAAADAEAAAAAAVPLPGAGGGVPAPTSKPRAPRSVLASSASKELLEPSGCYKGVWRVVGGPREGLYKAQISVPGRAGRPKRLDYFRTDMDAAQCYDRAALEKFGLEHADINFPATSYGYLEAGNYGLLQPKSSSRRPRGSTPLPTRQAVPEYLDEPLDPNSKSSFIGVRLARNCRGWAAKIKHKGEKHLIGTYRTEEEAARAWDKTAIWLRGPNTQTNFPIAQYLDDEALALRCEETGGSGAGRRQGGRRQQQRTDEAEQQASAALLAQQHTDYFAAAAAIAAAAAAMSVGRDGQPLVAAYPAGATNAATLLGGQQVGEGLNGAVAGGTAAMSSEGGSGGEETDEEGLNALRQQQAQLQQQAQQQAAAAAAATSAPAAAGAPLGMTLLPGAQAGEWRWGVAGTEGIAAADGTGAVAPVDQAALLAAAAAGQVQPAAVGSLLPQDLARLLAVAGLAYLPTAGVADPAAALQMQQQAAMAAQQVPMTAQQPMEQQQAEQQQQQQAEQA